MSDPTYLKSLNDFYNGLYKKFGSDSRSTGYSGEGQRKRYEVLTGIADLSRKKVLDVGSGLGDFLIYLNKHNIPVDFTGFDINEHFVNECNEKFPDVPFELRDMIQDTVEPESFDVVFFNGGINTKVDDNEQLMRDLVTAMYAACKDYCAITLTSIYADEDHKQDFMYFYDPAEAFRFAKTLTRNVSLLHHYLLNDFTLILFKK